MHAPVGMGSSSARIDNGLLAILAVAVGLTVANLRVRRGIRRDRAVAVAKTMIFPAIAGSQTG